MYNKDKGYSLIIKRRYKKMKNSLFDHSLFGDNVPAHIKGVSCNVKNCLYHDGDAYCTADRISVGPSFASACTDTVCATFRAKAR